MQLLLKGKENLFNLQEEIAKQSSRLEITGEGT